jgi:hypothetical protein
MAKEFNPDDFLAATAPIAEAQSETERRNQERQAAGQSPLTPQQAQAQTQAAMSPSGAPIAPVRPGFSEAPGEWAVNNVVAPAYGVMKGAGDIAAAHPTATAVGGELLAAALPQTNIPVLKQAQQLAKAPFKLGEAVMTAADAWKSGAAAQQAQAATNAATQEMRVLERLARGTGPEAQAAGQRLQQLMQNRIPSGPVAPAAPAMAPAPTAGPVAPAGMPAAAPAQAAEAGLLDKTTAMIRQLAANKVLQGVAKGGVGLAAMSPTSTGPAVPSTGRMKGMEINPVTGRPWTPEQIQQYEANPSMYDAQLGAPQFRR